MTINKATIGAVCIDDFALKKRQNYGTIMINLIDGRVIDIIESRDKVDMVPWLSEFPNIRYGSRDGSLAYATAIREAHPEAHQISDRFHLVKGLTDTVALCLYKFLSGRVVIPLTKEQETMNELLTSKPARRARILLVNYLASQGRTMQDIRSQTKHSLQTIRKYIRMPEEEIPEDPIGRRGREYQEAPQKTMDRVEEVRALQKKGDSLRKITDKTGYTWKTIKNYLSPHFNSIHCQYGGVQRWKEPI